MLEGVFLLPLLGSKKEAISCNQQKAQKYALQNGEEEPELQSSGMSRGWRSSSAC
jgi:hypothetical protein